MHHHNGTHAARIPQGVLLDAIQQGESFVYAMLTREGAVKVGVTRNLMKRKSGGIKFGGVERYLGFMPGEYEDEQRIHASLAEHRIYGTQEYYYPAPEVLPAINAMREWAGIEPLVRRDLPRIAQCKFLGRVSAAQAQARQAS